MIVWLDAQLPPTLAPFLNSRFPVQAVAVRDLGLRDASDAAIFSQAREVGATVITKDSDFLELSLRHGPPPRIVWLTCGNCGNRELTALFERTFDKAIELLSAGETVVEISGKS